MKFYTNIYQYNRNVIKHMYIEDGKRYEELVEYQPIRGWRTDQQTKWKDIYGHYLSVKRFESVDECNTWEKENKYLEIYGDISNTLAYLSEQYHGDIVYDKSKLNIYSMDIEANGEQGFPVATHPNDFVSAVTFHNLNKDIYYTFGLKPYTPEATNIHYLECKDEKKLLCAVMDFFTRQNIDILTGWYLPFDIPYLIDRVEYLWGLRNFELNEAYKDLPLDKREAMKTKHLKYGENKAKEFSPDKKIFKGTRTVNKRKVEVYRIQGIVQWDYLDLYQKFTADQKENYTLDFTAYNELGEEKLEYKEEYGDLPTLYKQNHQMYISYNIKDTTLIKLLDDKLKFIDIALGYCYMMKCGHEDIFGTVRPWDALLYNTHYHNNILCSPLIAKDAVEYLGGYVKEPDRGRNFWLTVFDVVSSYPEQMIQNNLSPETIISETEIYASPELVAIRNKYTGIEKCLDIEALSDMASVLEEHNLAFTCNGEFFRRDKQGFIPELVEKIFNERMAIKGMIKNAKTKAEKEQLEARSYVLKICINSVYGCMGSNYFRYYDPRIASAVTWQGQLCARGVAQYLATKVDNIDWKYSDTDSIFFSLEKIVKLRFGDNPPDNETVAKFLLMYQDKMIQPKIDEFFIIMGKNFNNIKTCIKMEHECLAPVSILVEKKKYVMAQIYKEGTWFIDKPKYKIKGIEVVRSSTPKVARDKLKKALELIFETDSNETLIAFAESFRREFYKLPFEMVASPRGVNKMDKYNFQSKCIPIQVRASMVFNKALKAYNLQDKYQTITNRSKIKFCYLKVPNWLGSNIVGVVDKLPPELIDKFVIDYPLQFEKAFVNPLKKIFDSLRWQFYKDNDADGFFEED